MSTPSGGGIQHNTHPCGGGIPYNAHTPQWRPSSKILPIDQRCRQQQQPLRNQFFAPDPKEFRKIKGCRQTNSPHKIIV